ncbi:hypothetical protein NPIL_258421, partial [Nephila pilipes]
ILLAFVLSSYLYNRNKKLVINI